MNEQTKMITSRLLITSLFLVLVGCDGGSLHRVQDKESSSADAQWRVVLEVSGKSIKETESFTIKGDEWRVTWSVKGGDSTIFQIYVYNANGSLKGAVANVRGPDSDSSVIRGAGTYYLKILNTGQPYGIVVDDKY